MPKKKAAPTPTALWPLVKFTFDIQIGPRLRGTFQEITGIATGDDAIAPRRNDPAKPPRRPSVPATFGQLTLKRGAFSDPAEFTAWTQAAATGTVKRTNVVIRLLDENGQPAAQWHVSNAWPTKIALATTSDEPSVIAIESLELNYETLVIGKG